MTTAARNEPGFPAPIHREDGSLSHYAVVAYGKVVARIAPEKMPVPLDPLYDTEAWRAFE